MSKTVKVKFNVNLGSRDAVGLDLAFADCTAGTVHEVSAETYEALKKIGPAVVSEVASSEKVSKAKEPEAPKDEDKPKK